MSPQAGPSSWDGGGRGGHSYVGFSHLCIITCHVSTQTGPRVPGSHAPLPSSSRLLRKLQKYIWTSNKERGLRSSTGKTSIISLVHFLFFFFGFFYVFVTSWLINCALRGTAAASCSQLRAACVVVDFLYVCIKER